MKKIFAAILFLYAALFLTGCCVRHNWSEASCVHTQYCLDCGRQSDYIMEHRWIEPDCTQPQRCSMCGMSKGIALGHTVAEGVCTVCGEQLYSDTADFEKYNIIADMQPDSVYAFTTSCKNAPELTSTGEIWLSGFGPIPADERHPERVGYEWHYVIINALFHDENARSHGVTVMADCEDYYNIALRGGTHSEESDGMAAYTVINKGQELQVRYRRSGTWSGWYKSQSGRRENLYTSVWEIERPAGYDGVVVGLHSGQIQWPEGKFLNEVYDQSGFYFFRLG